MPVLRTLHHPPTRDRVLDRIGALSPDARRRWGRMDVNQMFCHLTDLYRFALGERDGPLVGNVLHHTVVKWIAVTVPLRWPHGFPTARQFDQRRDGTPPTAFEADRATLVDVIRRFASPDAPLLAHPLFGPMTPGEWGRWGFRHADHHLRQFGA